MSSETQVETVRQAVTDAVSIVGEVMSEVYPFCPSLEDLADDLIAPTSAVFLRGAS